MSSTPHNVIDLEASIKMLDATIDRHLAEKARLKALNTELLAALKDTLDYWECTGFANCEPDCDCIVEAVRAAIAHAEGVA